MNRLIACSLLVLPLAACVPMGNLNPTTQAVQAHTLAPTDFARLPTPVTRVLAGDTLRIVRDEQDVELNLRNGVEDAQALQYVVRPDGSFAYQYAGRIDAAGKTPEEVAQLMHDRLAKVYRDPNVTINIVSSPSSKVVIGGAVHAPATFDLNAVATLEQGLFAAGGMLPTADPSRVALLRLDDKQRYQLYFLDFAQLLQPGDEGGRPTMSFQRGDILFVPKSSAGNAGDGVDIFSQLLPFTRSIGLSYDWGRVKTTTPTSQP